MEKPRYKTIRILESDYKEINSTIREIYLKANPSRKGHSISIAELTSSLVRFYKSK